MRALPAKLTGVAWLAAGAVVFWLAWALGKDWAWVQPALGLAVVVALLMGMLNLSPTQSARLVAQVAVLRALVLNQPSPDRKAFEKAMLSLFEPTSSDGPPGHRIAGEDAPPPSADEWNLGVRPVLHQASQYTAPTYYLNANIQVIDWNLAFDLVFEPLVGDLRGRHVNWLIARLENSKEVFAHAHRFPTQIDLQPQVDTEPLVYQTERYGQIRFEKVATKLHDRDGHQRGWAVTLLIREAGDWDGLVRDLAARIGIDKFWSLYSVSYDRVLTRYPEYETLLQAVKRFVPDGATRVVDLGAGTGNMARLLLQARDRTVWAVEKNIAMLDLLRGKDFARAAGDRLKIVKSSVEHLEMLAAEDPFDAATAVNLLYAVDDVPRCLASVGRVLKPGGAFVLTTTDSETKLTPLLNDIRARLLGDSGLAPHLDRVRELNLKLEASGLTTRYSRDQYEGWLRDAGFVVESVERAYVGAVLLIRARKRDA